MTLFTWFICQILGDRLVGFCRSNTFPQWMGMLAAKNNCSDCWVCTEFLTKASASLLWWIHPMNQTCWDWLQSLNISDPLFKQMHEKVLYLMRE